MRARDLQSSNGTYLNGERLTVERLLNDGDRITIGETDIIVRITAPAMEEVGATVRLDDASLECPACGAELPVHAEFCARCGHRLGDAAAAAAGAPAPPPPPASAPAVLPPPAVPPFVPPPLGPPPAARTEVYTDPAAMAAPPSAGPRARADGSGELLPPIADEVFHSRPGPVPPPPAGLAASPRPALPVTPSPGAVTASPRPSHSVGPPVAAAPAAVGAPAAALRPAGFWIRVVAQVIDGIWMAAVVFVLTLPFGGLLSPAGSTVSSLGSLLLGIVVPVLGWGIFGATPGKALLGLRVIGGKRRRGLGLGLAFLRLCGVVVSAALFGLGFLMVAFTRDKRGLHDHLAGTAVIRR